ncbi:MAG TPA: PAS domain S-box protein [Terriglobales bacterium]|nr:PAS domain S-box protein [Terriglobales bacterium]
MEASAARRYACAILASAAVLVIRATLDPILGTYLPYVTLYLGVVFAAWYCGTGPAAVNAVVSLIAADYWFIKPRGSVLIDAQHVAGSLTFLCVAGLIIAMGEKNRRTLRNLSDLARELEHARSLFRIFMDNSPAVAYLKDEEGKFVFYNARARDRFGLADKPGGMSERVPRQQLSAEFIENDATVMREGVPLQFTETTHDPDGEHHWLSFRFPVVDVEGRKFVGSKSFDITEQRRAQEALRESEERFRAIVETANEGIWLVDRQARTLYVNRRLAEMLGYSTEEIQGRTMLDFCFPEEVEPARERIGASIRGTPEQFDFRFRRKNGSEILVLASTSPVKNGSGNAIGALGMFSDVTDRRRAAEALRQTQERLVLAQHAGRIAVWEWDLQTDKVTFFRDIPVLAEFSSMSDGRDWRRVVHPEDRDGLGAVVREAIRNCGEYEAEYRVIGFSDAPTWLGVRARVIGDENGKAVRVLGIASDVTERKRTEAALIQSQKLASAGRMAATVAHEINNPLEAVFNLIYLALMDTSLSPGTKKALETADQELQRIAQITKQTLGFYRERSTPRSVDIQELMDQALHLLARRLEAKNIRVCKKYAAQCSVTGIAGELRQVFSNLIANSVEAMANHGTLYIRISRVNLTGDSQVRITVADTGSGIDPENVQNIFEPFFTTKKHVGTGLGLWVSENIVRGHGGAIRVRSKIGKGTVVCVSLPVETPAIEFHYPAAA